MLHAAALSALLLVSDAEPAAVLLAGASTPRFMVAPEQDDELVLATAQSASTALVLLADEERGAEQVAGIVWMLHGGDAHASGVITSTARPLDPAQKRPPFHLGAPPFAAVAAIDDGFLVVGRELAGDAQVFVASISSAGQLASARYLPELADEPIGSSARFVAAGADSAWLFYTHAGKFRATRVAATGIVVAPITLAKIDTDARERRMFDATARADGAVDIVWLDDGALRVAVLDSDGMFHDAQALAMTTQRAREPALAREGEGIAVAWIEGSIRVARWDAQRECVMPPTSVESSCSQPDHVRIGKSRTQFVLGWRCADTRVTHVVGLEEGNVAVEASGRYFELSCSDAGCVMFWQNRGANAKPGPWLWSRSWWR